MNYRNQFFKTEQEAKSFIKSKGSGILYKNTGATEREYKLELLMAGHGEAYADNYPYCVAWNELAYE